MVVIPNVENVSEAVVRIMRRHNVSVAMKPYKTKKSVLVHPKDKQEKEDFTECVYEVPCANCDKTYIGETGRKFGVRLQERNRNTGLKWNPKQDAHSLECGQLYVNSLAADTDDAINCLQACVAAVDEEQLTAVESTEDAADMARVPAATGQGHYN